MTEENKILEIIDKHYEGNVNDTTRRSEIKMKRQIVHFMMRSLTKMSLARIGGTYGNRDHSTVVNSMRVISNDFWTDAVFRREFRILIEDFIVNGFDMSKCYSYLFIPKRIKITYHDLEPSISDTDDNQDF